MKTPKKASKKKLAIKPLKVDRSPVTELSDDQLENAVGGYINGTRCCNDTSDMSRPPQ